MKRKLLRLALCAFVATLPMGAWADDPVTIGSYSEWYFDQYYSGASYTGTTTGGNGAVTVIECDGLYFGLTDQKSTASTLTFNKNVLDANYVDNTKTIFEAGTYAGLELNRSKSSGSSQAVNSTTKGHGDKMALKINQAGTLYVLCSGGYASEQTRQIACYKGETEQAHVTLVSGNHLVVLKVTIDESGKSWHICGSKQNTSGDNIRDQYTGKILICGVKFIPTTPAKTSLPTASISTGYATYCSSHDWYVPTNFLAYYATSVGDNKVQMTEIAAGKIVPAGEAVILKRASGEATSVTPQNALTTDDNYSTNLVSISGNLLKPNLASYALPTSGTAADANTYYNYTLAYENDAPVFKHSNGEGILAANKAYLRTTVNVEGGSARGLELVFDEEGTTGISATLMNNERMNNEYYDLQGRKVAQPTRGLYIVNGKKVIIK